MANVLVVPAFELCNPIVLFINVEANDTSLSHLVAPNARGKLRRSEAEGTNRRSLLASA